MEIKEIDSYKDGGTIRIDTTVGQYCIDCRLGTTTRGMIFSNYPEDDNSNMVPDQDEVRDLLINALSEYKVSDGDFDWSVRARQLLLKDNEVIVNKVVEFKSELKELLAKYNAEIWADSEGDGFSSQVVIDIDYKEILRVTTVIQHGDIK